MRRPRSPPAPQLLNRPNPPTMEENVCRKGLSLKRCHKGDIHVEICSACHPFFTGKQRLVDTAGRVERFRRKYAKSDEAQAAAAATK